MRAFLLLALALLAEPARAAVLYNACPNDRFIYPCKCSYTVLGFRVICAGVDDCNTLRTPFVYLAQYKLHTLALKNVNFTITADFFSGLDVGSIKVEDSVFRVTDDGSGPVFGRKLLGWKAKSTFRNLEDKLEMLHVRRSKLDLGNTNLGPMKKLKNFSIDRSHIRVLRKSWFDGLTQLHWFVMDSSRVEAVEDEALSGLANVKVLTWRTSDMAQVRRTYFPPIAYELTYLDLSDNRLSSLPDDIFSNMPVLETVVLSRNEFKVLLEQPWVPVLNQLRTIHFDGNPLVCNSTSAWLMRSDVRDKVSGTCSEPPNMRGRGLATIDPVWLQS